jgi:hypothetical protein
MWICAIHLEQYAIAKYSTVPTIGSLFLLNFIAATALGLVLLVPIRPSASRARRRIDGRRRWVDWPWPQGRWPRS